MTTTDEIPKPRPIKPLGRKSYGSIGHLQGSRMGPAEHICPPGQSAIATTALRDRHDLVIAQEKLDGSNVGVARINGEITPIVRAGYRAEDSPHPMHHAWGRWVKENEARFRTVLVDGDRLCGEWLIQAHGTRYTLPHEPFVAFDLMREERRESYGEFCRRVSGHFVMPRLLSYGGPFSIAQAIEAIATSGHGAIDPVEGVIWRVERKGEVDFLCKYVRPEKKDGQYLPSETGGDPIMNDWPGKP